MKKTIVSLSLFIISVFAYSQNLSLGLQAYYPFNGNANDASGNNNNPVFNNATLTSDAAGNPNSAYHFNGTDTYMKIPNSPTLNMNTQMSIALKVRPTGFYTGPCYNNMMLIKGDADFLPGNYSSRFSDVINGCNANASTDHEHFYSDNTVDYNLDVQTDHWYSVVWTYDGTSSNLYIDCKATTSPVVNNMTFTNVYDLYIGHLNNAQYPYWLNGDLDEIRIYNRALSQEEINIYNGNDFQINTNITEESVCRGTNVQLVATSTATAYHWDPSTGLSDPTINNPIATVNAEVTYIVTGTFGACEKKDTVTLHVYPSPFANAGPDKNIVAGDQVMLEGSGSSATSVLWSPANTLTGTNSFTPIAKPIVTTTYTLMLTDNNNCTATDEMKVFVENVNVSPCASPPEPMHAFTPNGDGNNDKWLTNADNSCTIKVSVIVFNRYDSPVYKNDNYQNDWEGTYKGKPLPDATYYFVNTYKLLDGRTVVKKGDVTILR